jgi:hypothetical protein
LEEIGEIILVLFKKREIVLARTKRKANLNSRKNSGFAD